MRNEQIRMANRPKLKQDQVAGMPQTLKPKQSQAAGMPQTPKPKLTILVVVLTAFVTTFTGSALNLSIPDLSQEFHAGAGMVGWLVTGYTLAVAACSVPAGRVAGYHQPEISTGDRSRFVYDLLYCSCFFYIHNDADFDSSSTGNRSSYDIQHQYSRTS